MQEQGSSSEPSKLSNTQIFKEIDFPGLNLNSTAFNHLITIVVGDFLLRKSMSMSTANTHDYYEYNIEMNFIVFLTLCPTKSK